MPNPTDDQIASVAIFSRLAPEDRALIAAVADLRTFSKGDVVFTEGEPANVILTILSGRIHVSSAAGRALDLPEVLTNRAKHHAKLPQHAGLLRGGVGGAVRWGATHAAMMPAPGGKISPAQTVVPTAWAFFITGTM